MYKFAENSTHKVWMNEIDNKTVSIKINKSTFQTSVDEQSVPNGTEITEEEAWGVSDDWIGHDTFAGLWFRLGQRPTHAP